MSITCQEVNERSFKRIIESIDFYSYYCLISKSKGLKTPSGSELHKCKLSDALGTIRYTQLRNAEDDFVIVNNNDVFMLVSENSFRSFGLNGVKNGDKYQITTTAEQLINAPVANKEFDFLKLNDELANLNVNWAINEFPQDDDLELLGEDDFGSEASEYIGMSQLISKGPVQCYKSEATGCFKSEDITQILEHFNSNIDDFLFMTLKTTPRNLISEKRPKTRETRTQTRTQTCTRIEPHTLNPNITRGCHGLSIIRIQSRFFFISYRDFR